MCTYNFDVFNYLPMIHLKSVVFISGVTQVCKILDKITHKSDANNTPRGSLLNA